MRPKEADIRSWFGGGEMTSESDGGCANGSGGWVYKQTKQVNIDSNELYRRSRI
jgi:hypothetical protein